uniref:RWP-RK domain-containing protein n=1 Tax=Percolomonas cosmopolitus TaxID=63605 RepID=A0A7S1PFS9_9EUKA|mmetsp:Transcript_1375/g.4739  ORF Transcript_1375/g.4739 Transcript_1375/m.4739 type:complete len:528 (+) Transcript_1375:717-2300(+)|eukprot:CAMPEP_0117443172 /NCGR_PEP_ID=MMETSP0759-20121206/4554_1 /TAXON_ID=63605 /ORGANISM="Percolomonas cosmopolitus, Strain WS" /LENGTH=527 /DNA_ID=CAMNT_0005235131 /DNA_START=473 /DNA_END=2056 /DNA_ORIENTATION=-
MPKPQHFLTKEEIQSVLDLKQKDAAVALSVSLASLKRYFQKFFPGQRWPRTPRERGKQRSFKKRAELNSKLQATINFIDQEYFHIPSLPGVSNTSNPLNEPPLVDSSSSHAESESIDDPDSPRSHGSNNFGASNSNSGGSGVGDASLVGRIRAGSSSNDFSDHSNNVISPLGQAAFRTNGSQKNTSLGSIAQHVHPPQHHLNNNFASNGGAPHAAPSGMLRGGATSLADPSASNLFGGMMPAGSGGLPGIDPSSGGAKYLFPAMANGEPDQQYMEYAKKNFSDPNVFGQVINKLLMENASLQQEHQKQSDQILQLQQEIFCHQNDEPSAYIQFASFKGHMGNVNGPWQTEHTLLSSSSIYAGFVVDRYFNLVACTDRFNDLTGYSMTDCIKGVNLMQGLLRLFSCRHYINLLKRFSTLSVKTLEFNESFKRPDGQLIHLRVLLKHTDSDPTVVYGWAKITDTFLDYILLDGSQKIHARISKKNTSLFTEDDALVAHMLTNKVLRDALESNDTLGQIGTSTLGIFPER